VADLWALWLALAIISLWVVLGASLNSGQWGDHFEQFVWAHSFELGYHKHPPLPTWMLAAAIHLFGPSPYWTYALAGVCSGGTSFFTYRIAQRLIGSQLAALAILLWGLQQAFSVRAQLFNHNTVMMLTVSATAWCVLRALESPRRIWWIAAGCGAGLAMLSKYQSVVPLAGIVVALLLTRELARPAIRNGLWLAFGAAALVFAPHLLWMSQHDFSTLRYAAQAGGSLPWPARGMSVVGFLAQQVRLLFPALLVATLLWLLPGLRRTSEPVSGADDLAHWRRAWFIGLIVFPLVITVLTCPAFGLKLQTHWGYQCLQFVALWLAWRLRALSRHRAIVPAALALMLQGAFMTVSANPLRLTEFGRSFRADEKYPARQLAAAVQRDWQATTACRLTVVVGPTFEAGMVSVYSRAPPKVLEEGDFAKSPWIHPEEVLREGAVYVATAAGALPRQGVAMVNSMRIVTDSSTQGARIYWAIVPPVECNRPEVLAPTEN
jgi:4-amino-4-deoxy-L-arabinose transferase-like glycosyltransferase